MKITNLPFKNAFLRHSGSLKRLTLSDYSGMSYEMKKLLNLSYERPVNATVFLAHEKSIVVGWALCSEENSNFSYTAPNYEYYIKKFTPSMGVLFQVYVDKNHRGKGIAGKLLQKSKSFYKEKTIVVVPHDRASEVFYKKYYCSNIKEISFV